MKKWGVFIHDSARNAQVTVVICTHIRDAILAFEMLAGRHPERAGYWVEEMNDNG